MTDSVGLLLVAGIAFGSVAMILGFGSTFLSVMGYDVWTLVGGAGVAFALALVCVVAAVVMG